MNQKNLINILSQRVTSKTDFQGGSAFKDIEYIYDQNKANSKKTLIQENDKNADNNNDHKLK